MRSPRYTILLANRSTGAIRRLTVTRRAGALAVAALVTVPMLIGLGAGGGNPGEAEALRLTNESLRLENESYREVTGELAEQISSLQTALIEIDQTQLDPAARLALEKLPAVMRSRATGGASRTTASAPASVVQSPDGTFGMLKSLLGALENSLASVKSSAERQQARARATPLIWPLAGWLSSYYGNRRDPFNGAPDFHPGLDISADRGAPVKATADGRVESAGYNGNYGNSVLIEHGYGISTRFGHLSGFAVTAGQTIKRGQVVGYVGATGRATAPHLHYEILMNGVAIDPLGLLAK